jgi:nucleotide-binding universal stress UspA family protein
MSQRILVPLDGSSLAEIALNEALALAELPGSTVVLLHVVPPIEDVISDGETITIDQQFDFKEARAREYLRAVSQRPEWRKVKSEIVVETGKPAQLILDFARKNNIDRIVMATHGRTGVSRWIYGSVAAKVLEAADRTVVLVRAGFPQERRSPKIES